MQNTSAREKIIDITEYSNVDSVLDRPSIQNGPNCDFIREVAYIGYNNSKSGIFFARDLAEYVDSWERVLLIEREGLKFYTTAYNSLASAATFVRTFDDCKRCKEKNWFYMKRMIPLSYAIFGGIFLILSAVFIAMFMFGRYVGNYIIPPWMNLMLCVASVGLFITVVISIFEWRHHVNARETEKR